MSVILIKVPALRDRASDIPLLVDRFLEDIATEYGSKKKEIDLSAVELLQKHNWTGNIRELRNVVERLIIMSGGNITQADVEKNTEISN